MDWIKKHSDQFALALLALALIACSALLILRVQGFGTSFSEATGPAGTREKVPPLVLTSIDEAKKTLEAPPQWREVDAQLLEADGKTRKRGSLFVANRYVIENNMPKPPGTVSFHKDSLTGKDIPNSWFMDNNLPLLEPEVSLQDPDKDGFLNEDEWRGTDLVNPGSKSTDPNSKESHPAYHTKLFVKQFIRTPFRLEFKAHDFDPKHPEKLPTCDFQINTLDLRQPSEFLKLGEKVSNTKFKLEKFAYKTQLNSKTGEQDDVSELTLRNMETDELIILVLNRITDSPNFSMQFTYKWATPPLDFVVKKGGVFGLKPNTKDVYKLIDSKEGKAQIQTPDGQQIEILPDPRK